MEYVTDEDALYNVGRYDMGTGGIAFRANGETNQMLMNMERERIGAIGYISAKLPREIEKYEGIFQKYIQGNTGDFISKIIRNITVIKDIEYVNIPSLVAVIMFLHITNLVNTLKFKNMFEKYEKKFEEILEILFVSIDIIHNTPKKVTIYKGENLETNTVPPINNKIIIVKYKQLFLRYIRLLIEYSRSTKSKLSDII